MHTAGLRVTFVALLASVAAMAVFAAPASAATKPYSLVICALGTDENCAPSPTSSANQPAAVPVGQTSVSMTATFTNENQAGIRLGSANLAPPAGFSVTSASVSGVSPFACPSSCTANVVGNVVQVRGLSVPSGSAVTVTMSANTPATPAACTVSSPCAWSVETKQANDFSGPPGNDLTLDTSTSTLSTVLAHLQFGTQPHNVLVTAPPPAPSHPITSNDYAPGTPVTVDIADASGTPVASYDGPVTVQLNPAKLGGFGAVLGGTSTCGTQPGTGVCVNAVNGVASFADLTVNVIGNGYTLAASTPDLPPPTTSDPNGFNVQQAAAVCVPGVPCAADATSTNAATTDGGVDVTVTSASGGGSELVESIDFGNWSKATRISECGAASDHFAYQAVTTPTLLSATIVTTDLELTKKNFNASVSAQEICLAESSPFTEKVLITGDGDHDGDDQTLKPAPPVTLPDGTPGFAGLEPDCGTGPTQVPLGSGPCVTSRSGKLNTGGVGGTLTITDSSPSDRWTN